MATANPCGNKRPRPERPRPASGDEASAEANITGCLTHTKSGQLLLRKLGNSVFVQVGSTEWQRCAADAQELSPYRIVYCFRLTEENDSVAACGAEQLTSKDLDASKDLNDHLKDYLRKGCKHLHAFVVRDGTNVVARLLDTEIPEDVTSVEELHSLMKQVARGHAMFVKRVMT